MFILFTEIYFREKRKILKSEIENIMKEEKSLRMRYGNKINDITFYLQFVLRLCLRVYSHTHVYKIEYTRYLHIDEK